MSIRSSRVSPSSEPTAVWVDDGKYLPPFAQGEMNRDELLQFLSSISDEGRLPCFAEDAEVFARSVRVDHLTKRMIGCPGISLIVLLPGIPLIPLFLGCSATVIGVTTAVSASFGGGVGAFITGTLPDRSSDLKNMEQNALALLAQRITHIAEMALSPRNISSTRCLMEGIDGKALCRRLQTITTQRVPIDLFTPLEYHSH